MQSGGVDGGEVGGREVRDAVPVHLDPLERVEVAGEGALAHRPDPAVAQLEALEGRQSGEGEILKKVQITKIEFLSLFPSLAIYTPNVLQNFFAGS